MTKVLFVCLGNICRSPAAEAIFIKKLEDHGLTQKVSCESAGILNHHQGQPCDPRMDTALTNRGFSSTTKSQQVRAADFKTYDFIIGMDKSNMEDLKKIQPSGGKASLHLMCEFAESRGESEVPDPYYGGDQGFELVIDILDDATNGFLNRLQA